MTMEGVVARPVSRGAEATCSRRLATGDALIEIVARFGWALNLHFYPAFRCSVRVGALVAVALDHRGFAELP